MERIAVIGGHADIGVLLGGGSAQVAPGGGIALALKQPGKGIRAFIKSPYFDRAIAITQTAERRCS